jgi:ABC-type Mn2+/Zn2+ transport system permease subunit
MAFAVIPAAIGGIEKAKLYAKEKSGAVLISHFIAVPVGLIGLIVLGEYFGGVGLAASVVLLQTVLAAALYAFRRK